MLSDVLSVHYREGDNLIPRRIIMSYNLLQGDDAYQEEIY